jgi:hypothetical protein
MHLLDPDTCIHLVLVEIQMRVTGQFYDKCRPLIIV